MLVQLSFTTPVWRNSLEEVARWQFLHAEAAFLHHIRLHSSWGSPGFMTVTMNLSFFAMSNSYIILECVANILLFESSSHYGIGPPFSFGPISSGVYQQSCKSSDEEYYHINWAVVKSKFYLVVSLNWKMREGESLDLSHSIWWSCLFFVLLCPTGVEGLKAARPSSGVDLMYVVTVHINHSMICHLVTTF
jgi:hypothetical protein